MKKQLCLLAAVLLLALTACGHPAACEAGYIAGAYQNTRWLFDSPDKQCEKTLLILEENGHFILQRCAFRFQPEKLRHVSSYQGRYDLEGPVLTLHCGQADYTLFYLDGKIYFDAMEKRPSKRRGRPKTFRAFSIVILAGPAS